MGRWQATVGGAANRFLSDAYLPAHNRSFAVAPTEQSSAFVAGGDLAEILGHREDRIVGNDNTVVFERLRLQIESGPLRGHFVKATVHHLLRARCIGRYDLHGNARHSQAA